MDVDDNDGAAANTFLAWLRLKLNGYLGWMTRVFNLTCYALLLMPGHIQVGCHYLFCSRSIRYGDLRRQRIDLYVPENDEGQKPVIVFVMGGAWIMGYKAWGSILVQQCVAQDIIVACIDYRNYPGTTISAMISDVSDGISFVFEHIAEYGGNPDQIYVIGQSMGAHIAACAILRQAIEEGHAGEINDLTWHADSIKHFFGLSGGYDLESLKNHYRSRGLGHVIDPWTNNEVEASGSRFSPLLLAQDPYSWPSLMNLPITLFHGTRDQSIPIGSSQRFAEELRSLSVRIGMVGLEGYGHTDIFLEDPMRGQHRTSRMYEQIIETIHGSNNTDAIARYADAPPRRRLVPEFMLALARRINPY